MTYTKGQSLETYLGVMRAAGYIGATEFKCERATFEPALTLSTSQWTLGG